MINALNIFNSLKHNDRLEVKLPFTFLYTIAGINNNHTHIITNIRSVLDILSETYVCMVMKKHAPFQNFVLPSFDIISAYRYRLSVTFE